MYGKGSVGISIHTGTLSKIGYLTLSLSMYDKDPVSGILRLSVRGVNENGNRPTI